MEINKEEVEQRFRRSRASYNDNARVQKMIVDRMVPMILSSVKRVPEKILEIGCGTGLLTSQLQRTFPNVDLYLNDLVEELCYHAATINQVPQTHCFPGDVEKLFLPLSFDLIASASTFQWFTTPEETFMKLSKQLEQNGVLVFSTFGKFNLREIRLTTGGGLDYRSKEELEKMLKPYFKIEGMEEELHTLEFDSPLAVLQHLKKTGVNVSGDPTIWTKGRMDAFIKDYNARFAVDGKVTLTYHPLYFVCRKNN